MLQVQFRLLWAEWLQKLDRSILGKLLIDKLVNNAVYSTPRSENEVYKVSVNDDLGNDVIF